MREGPERMGLVAAHEDRFHHDSAGTINDHEVSET